MSSRSALKRRSGGQNEEKRAIIAALAIANMGFQLKDNIDNNTPVEDTETNIEQPEEA